MFILFASCALLAMSSSPKTNIPDVSESSVRIMPVARTPESGTVNLRIAYPTEDKVYQNPVWIQFRIDGYSLGSASQFERASEIKVSNMGQTVHVIIDNEPYFAINEPAIDPYDESGFYYDMSYKFEVPHRLDKGVHTIRMFPARSFGESLKGDHTFAVTQFYVGEEQGNLNVDLTDPYLTFNEPNDKMTFNENQPILLDFLVSNAELSSDGYKVKVTVDDKISRVITSWQPFYLYGLKEGKHSIRLELLGVDNKIVPGPFNSVTRTIIVR